MAFSETTAMRKIASLNKKIRVVQGGTSASKTISILIYLIAKAQTDTTPKITSVVSESVPHLKRGALRDFKNIMQTQGYWKEGLWNATDSIYKFETGSQIEFFSTDNGDKLRGARRDRLFINEANNVPLDAFDQLEVRTKEFVFLDFNPTNEFWLFTDILPNRNDVEHIVLTYKDNEALSPEIVSSIEQRKNRTGWWKVYGLGQLGEVEGKIYTDWAVVESIPHEARLERYGLDFGYSIDPTAIVAVYRYNGGYILHEIAFSKGLSNKQIADILNNHTQALVVADSAEPKSIDEIASYGVSIVPARKGPDSIRNGIQVVQAQRISVTKASTNILREYRNYLWDTDKDGKIIMVPEAGFDHCFAPETLVHTIYGKKRICDLVGKTGYLYSKDGTIQRFHSVRPTRTNADVLTIEFKSGDKLTVTPDHLLLQPNGVWIEAQLLNPMDLIQSGTHGTNFQWKNISSLFRRALFKPWVKKASSRGVGALQRGDTEGVSRTSQGQEPGQQRYNKFGTKTGSRSSERTHHSRTEKGARRMGQEDSRSSIQVAFIRRGKGMAQATWEENIHETETFRTRMFSLPFKVFNYTIRKVHQILPSELQNESSAQEVVRITRGRRDVTYNLEVDNLHCFVANGVIVHNSMDAIRYAISSMVDYMPEHLHSIQQSQFIRNSSRQSLNSTK